MVYNLKKLLKVLRQIRSEREVLQICDIPSRKTLRNYMIVRCDIERDTTVALAFAESLKNEQILSSFYFHTRTNCYDAAVMKKIQSMGHEVGLHHECLDRCKGDFEAARELFLREVDRFREDGIRIKTVCAHGEAGITKKGYKSSYDLFEKYPNLIEKAGLIGEAYILRQSLDLTYAADTFGSYPDFFKNISYADSETGLHILIHPHRWHNVFFKSLCQILFDLIQRQKNKLLKERRYQTVLD